MYVYTYDGYENSLCKILLNHIYALPGGRRCSIGPCARCTRFEDTPVAKSTLYSRSPTADDNVIFDVNLFDIDLYAFVFVMAKCIL